jgi:MFS family permease
LQILVILSGMIVLIVGAFLFVQSAYYPGQKHNLAQQIALRLSMTGLVIASASGLADVLGFGSHPLGLENQRPLLGWWQTTGLIGGFVIASIGVLIFTLMGDPHQPQDSDLNTNDYDGIPL